MTKRQLYSSSSSDAGPSWYSGLHTRLTTLRSQVRITLFSTCRLMAKINYEDESADSYQDVADLVMKDQIMGSFAFIISNTKSGHLSRSSRGENEQLPLVPSALSTRR
ncbi:hypothetical protein AVEN_124055-1 [Araneus ventricosus]|uniref:Uncharacterized protein n=1 Tax=Araneus ventricosus TaxID=182803 RepID=A0A4Y2HQZ6_ARAVE|nr:hypothetical protein AVEN_124055-1 [Araneus ventricosus]